jgi:hypothetical protein
VTLDDRVREIVREELAKLLAGDADAPKPRAITDLDRQRARQALARAGVTVGPEAAKGKAR